MKPTKAQLKALRGIKECAELCDRPDGWATMWPFGTSDRTCAGCVEAGWLEKSVKAEGRLPYTAYRLTDAGRNILAKYGGGSDAK